jgi:hypothetical protein
MRWHWRSRLPPLRVVATNDGIRAGRRRQPARPPTARTSAIAAAVGVAVLAAGCSGSPTSEVARVGSRATQTSASSNASTASSHQNGAAFSRCMRSHGVPNFPDPTGGGEVPKVSLQQVGVSNSQLQSAQQACKSLWPTVSAIQQQQVRAQALRFSRCMRNHGISEFPDPDTNGGIRIPDSIENSPGLQAAMNACKPLPPPPNLGPPGGGG